MVVGMAAHLGAPSQAGSLIAAPPSSLQRSVRLTAEPAATRRAPARLVTTHTTRAQARPEVQVRNLAVVQRHHHPRRPPATRQLAGTSTPTAQPAPVAGPAAEPVPTPAPDVQPADHGHGRGHAYGQSKQDE